MSSPPAITSGTSAKSSTTSRCADGNQHSPARRLLRPANYAPDLPGWGVYEGSKNDVPYAVINLQGRVFMAANDDPFRVADQLLKEIKAKIIFVDLHAEATSEKLALAWYLDGRVTAVVGTHTHIPTADERVMPGGTAYITDVGMTGPYDSVIGVQKGTDHRPLPEQHAGPLRGRHRRRPPLRRGRRLRRSHRPRQKN